VNEMAIIINIEKLEKNLNKYGNNSKQEYFNTITKGEI